MNQGELFENTITREAAFALFSGSGSGNAELPESALFELSVDAFYSALYARMSELPIEGEISRYIEKVAKAGAGSDRTAAAKAAFDRGDPDVLTVLKASGRVQHEIHRLTGLLRFKSDNKGIYTARCSPDHFILPALADHFTARFGETPWAIIDEKRNICLYREINCPPKLIPLSEPDLLPSTSNDEGQFEELWKLYHSSVNNEAKNNPRLQRQFMPERYHKYLPEMERIR